MQSRVLGNYRIAEWEAIAVESWYLASLACRKDPSQGSQQVRSMHVDAAAFTCKRFQGLGLLLT